MYIELFTRIIFVSFPQWCRASTARTWTSASLPSRASTAPASTQKAPTSAGARPTTNSSLTAPLALVSHEWISLLAFSTNINQISAAQEFGIGVWRPQLFRLLLKELPIGADIFGDTCIELPEEDQNGIVGNIMSFAAVVNPGTHLEEPKSLLWQLEVYEGKLCPTVDVLRIIWSIKVLTEGIW